MFLLAAKCIVAVQPGGNQEVLAAIADLGQEMRDFRQEMRDFRQVSDRRQDIQASITNNLTRTASRINKIIPVLTLKKDAAANYLVTPNLPENGLSSVDAVDKLTVDQLKLWLHYYGIQFEGVTGKQVLKRLLQTHIGVVGEDLRPYSEL